jgi:putative exosortase-associated protein (TIGR04073 family)
MRKIIFPLAAVLTAVLFTGCAGPEQKLGRGLSNTYEIVRLGEMRQSMEQSAVFDADHAGYTTGAIHGFDQTVKRTGIGLLEVVSFPFPPYTRTGSKDLPAYPVYPDSYKPGRMSAATFDTDTFTGFTGGDIAPFIPGSRFKVFDN